MPAFITTFVGLGVAPRLAAAVSLAPNRVRLTFNEPMGDGATTAGNYAITPDVGSDARSVLTAALDGATVDLTLDGEMTVGVDNYSIVVTGAADIAGNAIDSLYDTATFSGFYAATPGIEDHCQEARDRLLEQFKGAVLLNGLVCALAEPAQAIEQAGADVLAFRSLETAFGAQLDRLGTTLAQLREGMTDGDYRVILRAKTQVRASRGRPDEMGAILRTLDDGFAVSALSLTESFPASAVMHALVPSGGELRGERYARMLREAKPAAVGVILEFEEDDVPIFAWEGNVGEGDAAPDPGTGWEINVGEGDVLPEAGGVWPEATVGDNS